jgi:hypothetical protein
MSLTGGMDPIFSPWVSRQASCTRLYADLSSCRDKCSERSIRSCRVRPLGGRFAGIFTATSAYGSAGECQNFELSIARTLAAGE